MQINKTLKAALGGIVALGGTALLIHHVNSLEHLHKLYRKADKQHKKEIAKRVVQLHSSLDKLSKEQLFFVGECAYLLDKQDLLAQVLIKLHLEGAEAYVFNHEDEEE